MKIQNAFRLGFLATLGVLVALALGDGIKNLATIFTYIGAALFLALGVDPLVSWLEKHRWPRPLAIVTVLLGILSVIAGFVLAIVPVIVEQVTRLVDQIPNLIFRIRDRAELQELWDSNIDFISYAEVEQNAQNFIISSLPDITGTAINTVFGIATGIFSAFIVLVLMLYFVASLGTIKRGLYHLVPASKREKFSNIAEQITKSVGRYVVGQVSLGLCNGVLTFLFLTVLGWISGRTIQYTVLLAFIAFLFSLIPLVGTVSGAVLITLTVWLFNGWPIVLIVGVWYLIYMQVEGYILSPRIMNRAVKVPGVLVVIAALAGGTLLGILGALVAIPVAAAVLLIVREVIVPRQNEL